MVPSRESSLSVKTPRKPTSEERPEFLKNLRQLEVTRASSDQLGAEAEDGLYTGVNSLKDLTWAVRHAGWTRRTAKRRK